jgi:hypothetical protein
VRKRNTLRYRSSTLYEESVEAVPLRGDVHDDVQRSHHQQRCGDRSVGGDGVHVRLKAHRDEVQNGVHCDVFLVCRGFIIHRVNPANFEEGNVLWARPHYSLLAAHLDEALDGLSWEVEEHVHDDEALPEHVGTLEGLVVPDELHAVHDARVLRGDHVGSLTHDFSLSGGFIIGRVNPAKKGESL